MTEPSPESSSSGRGKAPAFKVTDVVSYVRRDALLGRDLEELGVVTEVGQQLTVRPLAGHYVQVDPAAASPLSADDVG